MTMIRLLDNTPQVVSLGLDACNGLANFQHALATLSTTKPVAIKGNLNALTTEFGMTHCVSELWKQFAQQATAQGASIVAGDEWCNLEDMCVMSDALSTTPFVRSLAVSSS